jgi:Xaa-Pro aminopeptidase
MRLHQRLVVAAIQEAHSWTLVPPCFPDLDECDTLWTHALAGQPITVRAGTNMDYPTELRTKLERVRALMDAHGVGTLWLRRADNVAWLTGGVDVAVNMADSFGVASLVVTKNDCTIWTTTIEAPRLRNEDHVEERGLTVKALPWEGPGEIPIGSSLGVDAALEGAKDLSTELRALRMRLLPVEMARYRRLGKICADAIQASIFRTRPGMTEWEIAAVLGQETRDRGATPIVVLIATDDRIRHFRHPMPTNKVMDSYAMLVLCGRKEGLVCSVTRLVHYGPLPADLRHRMEACAHVDATMIAASRPGVTLGEMFTITQDAYARVGFDGEWKLHHQGGPAGYSPREFLAVPGEKIALDAGVPCAWNPSITGTKCEDSILVAEAGHCAEIVTVTDNWPTLAVKVNGQTFARPLILEMS